MQMYAVYCTTLVVSNFLYKGRSKLELPSVVELCRPLRLTTALKILKAAYQKVTKDPLIANIAPFESRRAKTTSILAS